MMKEILIIVVGIFSVCKISAQDQNDISTQRLFSILNISEKKQSALSEAVQGHQNKKPEQGREASRIWSKWTFTERMSLMSEIHEYEDSIVIQTWAVFYTNGVDGNRDTKHWTIKIEEDKVEVVKDYANKAFVRPLPLSMENKQTLKNDSSSIVIKEIFRNDERPLRWAVRNRYLLGNKEMDQFILECRKVENAIGNPIF